VFASVTNGEDKAVSKEIVVFVTFGVDAKKTRFFQQVKVFPMFTRPSEKVVVFLGITHSGFSDVLLAKTRIGILECFAICRVEEVLYEVIGHTFIEVINYYCPLKLIESEKRKG
jgi:hypothetical protein